MANDPFTIRIFVPDGDPKGVRLIDRMAAKKLVDLFGAAA